MYWGFYLLPYQMPSVFQNQVVQPVVPAEDQEQPREADQSITSKAT